MRAIGFIACLCMEIWKSNGSPDLLSKALLEKITWETGMWMDNQLLARNGWKVEAVQSIVKAPEPPSIPG